MATIGYTTSGGSAWVMIADYGIAYGEDPAVTESGESTITDGDGGVADGFTIDVNSTITSGEYYDVGIYSDTGVGTYGDPDTLQTPLLADGVEGSEVDEETDSGLSGPTLAASTMFWIAIWCDSGYEVAYDGAFPDEVSRSDNIGSGGLPSSWDTAGDAVNTRRMTMSVTYTAAGVASGSVCWGHVTGVTEDNTRTFTTNWTGTGTVALSGDNEVIRLATGEYMESEVVNVGAGTASIDLDEYATGFGSPTVQYKDGDSEANCEADTWNTYSAPFTSQGYVKVRLEE